MTSYYKSNQAGRSMIEMLGVLAIIGVLSVGGISGYSKAMAKFKLTKAQDQLSMLLMNIRTAYATSPSYSGLTLTAAIQYNIVPSDMVVSGQNKVKHAFGGPVEISATGTDDTQFEIKFQDVGKEACRSIATSDWGSDGFVSLKVNSETASATPGNPIPLGTGVCSNSENKNTLTWIYY